ncbi:hypothetical protein B9Z19DRAFT_990024, partial [Tuber borchii]
KLKLSPAPVVLQGSRATIPLCGIDVPFDCRFLGSGAKPFESFLIKIVKSAIGHRTVMVRYIPYVMARPFQIDKQYF